MSASPQSSPDTKAEIVNDMVHLCGGMLPGEPGNFMIVIQLAVRRMRLPDRKKNTVSILVRYTGLCRLRGFLTHSNNLAHRHHGRCNIVRISIVSDLPLSTGCRGPPRPSHWRWCLLQRIPSARPSRRPSPWSYWKLHSRSY